MVSNRVREVALSFQTIYPTRFWDKKSIFHSLICVQCGEDREERNRF